MSTLSASFIIEITKRDFKERFAGSVLGVLWVIIWPLVNLFIYIVIFGKLMGARLPGTSDVNAYGIYLYFGADTLDGICGYNQPICLCVYR